jgi:hypothetical protein
MRPVFDGSRCCGFLLPNIRGIAAHDAIGKKIGDYPEDGAEAAIRKLRFIASQHST